MPDQTSEIAGEANRETSQFRVGPDSGTDQSSSFFPLSSSEAREESFFWKVSTVLTFSWFCFDYLGGAYLPYFAFHTLWETEKNFSTMCRETLPPPSSGGTSGCQQRKRLYNDPSDFKLSRRRV